MPEIYVHAVKGRSMRSEESADQGHHRGGGEERPGAKPWVEIVESEPTSKAKGGVLFSEMRR